MGFSGLRRRQDFTRAYRQGVKVFGRLMVVFVYVREDGEPRLGITATRKVGGAVLRNRCRRRVREAARACQELVSGVPVDVVVNVKRELATAAWRDVVEEFARCVEKGLARAGQRA